MAVGKINNIISNLRYVFLTLLFYIFDVIFVLLRLRRYLLCIAGTPVVKNRLLKESIKYHKDMVV